MVKAYIALLAIIVEYMCMILAAAKYGFKAAMIVLCAIIANCIQAYLKSDK